MFHLFKIVEVIIRNGVVSLSRMICWHQLGFPRWSTNQLLKRLILLWVPQFLATGLHEPVDLSDADQLSRLPCSIPNSFRDKALGLNGVSKITMALITHNRLRAGVRVACRSRSNPVSQRVSRGR